MTSEGVDESDNLFERTFLIRKWENKRKVTKKITILLMSTNIIFVLPTWFAHVCIHDKLMIHASSARPVAGECLLPTQQLFSKTDFSGGRRESQHSTCCALDTANHSLTLRPLGYRNCGGRVQARKHRESFLSLTKLIKLSIRNHCPERVRWLMSAEASHSWYRPVQRSPKREITGR